MSSHDITLSQAISHLQWVAHGGAVQDDFADDLEVILAALDLKTQLLGDCHAQLNTARKALENVLADLKAAPVIATLRDGVFSPAMDHKFGLELVARFKP